MVTLTALHVFLLGIFSQGLPAVLSDVQFVPQDLTVDISSNNTFKVISTSPFPQNVTVKFVVNFTEIVKTEPTEIVIPANVKNEWIITVQGLNAGHTLIIGEVNTSSINANEAYIRVTSQHSSTIALISVVVGWIYFVAWSVSFYPQVYENWQRKSVVGLNFDFLSLNLMGFLLYSLFNCGLYWIPEVKDEFYNRHAHSAIPVQPNDIFFSVHATLATSISVIQCFLYESGSQRVSVTARLLLAVFTLLLTIILFCSVFKLVLWLDFLNCCSYVKLTITLIKYIPQAYMNFQRKSTIGWSIGNIFLDFTGGILSMLQMILNAYNYNDWQSIFTDPTKFGLGLFSVVFDIFFLVQHFILYRYQEPYQTLRGYEPVIGINSPDEEPETTASCEESDNQKDTYAL